ncbi:hypothetical protein GCM10010988_37180 [Cnuibacter physcomitrellae]|uniref:Uncharacterized protein n=1 Tax=Cnuibacter physcomitrellae TaxID=1619308 RepID=A0A1X9LJP8_9MICO|nr:hypothetical protein [Cnuibacter physcomitrellae]ARJ04712.1 hypothetical protein B5808_05340 [Cnuibacter physcomitrellae]MCS5499317.1 hypothetical protein [Cnuibacter physcomitrellae]GGI42067.1 hypothetical protein GCM10010988_37180 [Cnuibacter physcomitrellae]
MRSRFASIAVVATLVTFGTAGCAFITPQATVYEVETSDGVNANVGDISIRNATLISDDEGELASMLVSFVSTSQSDELLTVQYEDAATGERVSQKVSVAGNQAISSYGGKGGDQILLENVSKPGSLFPVFFQYGSEEGQQVLVPVLNDSLPEYSGLAPTPSPTPTPRPTAPATTVPTPVPTNPDTDSNSGESDSGDSAGTEGGSSSGK